MFKTLTTIILTLVGAYLLLMHFPQIREQVFPTPIDRNILQDSLTSEILVRDSVISKLANIIKDREEDIKDNLSTIKNLDTKIKVLRKEVKEKKDTISPLPIDTFLIEVFKEGGINVDTLPVIKDSTILISIDQGKHIKRALERNIDLELKLNMSERLDSLNRQMITTLATRIVHKDNIIDSKDKVIEVGNQKFDILAQKFSLLSESELELRREKIRLEKQNKVYKKIVNISIPIAVIATTLLVVL